MNKYKMNKYNKMNRYCFWYVPYCLWFMVIGMDLPKGGVHDTTFHSVMRGGMHKQTGKIFGRSTAEIQMRLDKQDWVFHKDFLIFTIGHMVVTNTIGTSFAVLCFQAKWIYGSLLVHFF